MKKNLTEMVFILDRSGSMSGLESDTIGGFNSMIEKQKTQEGEAFVSVVLFDDRSEVIYDRVKLSEIRQMTREDYFVRGCTALYDAVGDAIKHIANIHKYAREEDVPEHTVFVITTDGMENASRSFTQDSLKKLIEQQKEKHGWEFIFIGANIDSVKTAKSVGISEDMACDYEATETGTRAMFAAMAAPLMQIRAKGKASADWKEQLRK
ncbi:vWA domain-containing protein [Ruminococcus sp. NK3A76]|uniref:vWA domain-containing protein n=1 Tax=Ruminococcus sp. NK3A76 TaxID=877411 RepID=UPI00048EFE59|nr:vWA domain-containing protein [Ruminococcus sp. NK3A76]